MKKRHLLSIISSLFLLMGVKHGFAQSIPTFCLSVDLNSSRNLCGTSTYDGNYVAAGIVDIGVDQKNFLAKCDGAGNILWSHDMGAGSTDDFYGIMETSDHSIVVVGFASGKMCMVKYDHDGNEVWKKDILVQTFDYLSDIIETSDGNYLLTGDAEDSFHGWHYCAVLKITPAGDLVWNKNFYGTYHAETGHSITETADHRYVIGGYSSFFSDQYFLLSLDETGTVQWIKKTVNSGVAFDLVATSDSGVVVAGYTCTVSGCDANLSKIDASGNLEWSYTYGDSLFERFYSIVELPDGGFAMAGDATDQFYIHHGFVVKCDSSGQRLWGKITNDIEFRSIGNSGDGGIIMSSRGGTGFGIVKMDADGNSCPDCPSTDYGVQQAGTTFTDWSLSEFNATAVISSSGMLEVNLTPTVTVYCTEVGIDENRPHSSLLKIFPDPANEFINVRIPDGMQNAEIELLNEDGKVLEEFSARSSTIQISTRQLCYGMYLLRMNDSEKFSAAKFLVEH